MGQRLQWDPAPLHPRVLLRLEMGASHNQRPGPGAQVAISLGCWVCMCAIVGTSHDDATAGELEVQARSWWQFQFEGRSPASQLTQSGREQLPLPFRSIQGSIRLGEVRPHRGGPAALFRLLIPMSISSRNTQNNVEPKIWEPCGPVRLTRKINHYRVGGDRYIYTHCLDCCDGFTINKHIHA